MSRALPFLLVSVCAAEPAIAGPWTQAPGGGYGRVATALQSIDGIAAARFDIFAEYGLTGRWTVTGKVEGVVLDGAPEFNAGGGRLTLRRGIWSAGAFHVAVEGGIVGGEAIDGNPGGCSGVGGEARLSFGASGRDPRGRNWFAFSDIAAREYRDCRRQRAEFGAGRQLLGPLWLTSQFYIERGTEDTRSDKWEFGFLYRSGRYDWAINYRQELSGQFSETGIVLSIARQF